MVGFLRHYKVIVFKPRYFQTITSFIWLRLKRSIQSSCLCRYRVLPNASRILQSETKQRSGSVNEPAIRVSLGVTLSPTRVGGEDTSILHQLCRGAASVSAMRAAHSGGRNKGRSLRLIHSFTFISENYLFASSLHTKLKTIIETRSVGRMCVETIYDRNEEICKKCKNDVNEKKTKMVLIIFLSHCNQIV